MVALSFRIEVARRSAWNRYRMRVIETSDAAEHAFANEARAQSVIKIGPDG